MEGIRMGRLAERGYDLIQVACAAEPGALLIFLPDKSVKSDLL